MLTFSFCVIFIVGVCGNLLVCSLFKNKVKVRSTEIENLIYYLAYVDLVASIVNPVVWTYWTVTHHKVWHFGQIGCKILPSLTRILVSVSMGIISLITVDRYYVICRPYEERIARWKIKVALVLVVVFSVAIDIPYIFHQEVKPGRTCGVQNVSLQSFIYPIIVCLISRDVAFAFMFCGTVYKIRGVLNDHQKKEAVKQLRKEKSLSRVTVMLTVMATIFMFLVFPRDVLHIVYFTSWLTPPGLPFNKTILDVNSALKVLHMTNSVVNVFIYSRLHGKFRKRLRRKVSRMLGRKIGRDSLDHINNKDGPDAVLSSSSHNGRMVDCQVLLTKEGNSRNRKAVV